MKLACVRWGSAGILFTALVGCAGGPPVMVDGHSMRGETWARDSAAVRSRAMFDLDCQDVTLKVVGTFEPGNSEIAMTIGAVGCGRRATYARVPGTTQWVLNGSTPEVTPRGPSVAAAP